MTAPTRRRSTLLALLIAVCAMELVLGLVRHRDTGELEQSIESGAPHQRVEALYILSSRDTPRNFRPPEVRELLASGPSLVREWTMTPNFRRVNRNPVAQQNYLETLPDSAERRRSLFLFERERGTWMSLEQFRAFLDDRDR